VARGAADGFEDGLALIHLGGDGATRGNFCSAHEKRQVDEIVVDVIRVRDAGGFACGGNFVWE